MPDNGCIGPQVGYLIDCELLGPTHKYRQAGPSEQSEDRQIDEAETESRKKTLIVVAT